MSWIVSSNESSYQDYSLIQYINSLFFDSTSTSGIASHTGSLLDVSLRALKLEAATKCAAAKGAAAPTLNSTLSEVRQSESPVRSAIDIYNDVGDRAGGNRDHNAIVDR